MSYSSGSRPNPFADFSAVLLAGVAVAALVPLASAYAEALVQVAQADPSPLRLSGRSPVAAELSEVIVTAGRRATDLQKTPTAVSTVSSAALDASFINEIAGLNAIVPSLEITQANGSENLVSIRGVGSETPENTATTTPGVSEFVDGVYIVNSVSLDETLFDIDRIEVLRGPQGDLYGESSIGGAINLVTEQPELSGFGGSGDVSGGDYDLVRARAEVNVPVGDDVAIRASVQKYSHEGFTKDTYFPDFRLDDADDVSGKAAVLWKPIANFSATVTGQWYHALENGAAQKNLAEADTDPREVYQDYPGKFELTNQLYHVNLQYDLPWFSVRSVTGYQHENFVYHYDSSRSAFSVLGAYDDVAAYNTNTSSYTEEFDLLSRPGSRLEWTVGAFVLNEESRGLIAEFEGPPPAGDPETDPALVQPLPNIQTSPPSNLAYGNALNSARQGYAGFGRATYHLTPKLSFTLGARVNHDAYTNRSFNFSEFGSSTISHNFNDTVPTGRVETDYQVTPQNMVYASAARGYKPGGLNGKNGQAVVPESFHDETNTAYEVGSKNTFLDNQLRLNLAAFYYFYRNMQYIEYDPVPFASGIANIPSVHEYGLEAEAAFQSHDRRLHLNASTVLENGIAQGGYKTIDSTIANAVEGAFAYPCIAGRYTLLYPLAGTPLANACAAKVEAAAEDIKGKTPPDMPKISGSVTGSYDFDVPFGVLTPRVQYVYRGGEWARIFNVAGLDRVRAYGVTNFNLDYVPTGTGLRFSLTATNAFNVDGVNSRYTDPYGTGQTSQEYIPPRQIIGTVAYKF